MLKYKNIGIKDEKIISALQKNSRLPLSIISRKVGLLRETVYYRIVNLEKRGIIKKFITFIDISKFDLEIYSVFLNLNTSSLEIRNKIFNEIKENPYVTWASVVGSTFDIIFAIQAKNARQFKLVYSKISEKFKDYVQNEQFSQRIKLNIYPKYPYKLKTFEEDEYSLISDTKPAEIDELDRKILSVLIDDSRTNLVDIASKIKVPFTTIQSRIKRLEQKKIIQGYGILLDYSKLGFDVSQVLLQTSSLSVEDTKKLKDFCKGNSNIIYNIETLANWSHELTIIVENNLQLQEIINKIKELLNTKLKEIKIIPTFDYYFKFSSLGKFALE
jgi:Lrp/AsnC family transcriptional regulator for asnA, asnC and gidA